MTLIAGIYPGGPARGDDSSGEEPAPPLRSGEDLEARMREGLLRGRRKRRSRLVRWVTIGGAALAVGLGAYLGFSASDTPEELAEADRAAQEAESDDIDAKLDRVMEELWRMEAEEARRGGGRE